MCQFLACPFLLVTDKYAEKMEEIINSCEDIDTLENKLREVEKDIQQESFGTIWIDSNKKKRRRRKLEEKKEPLSMRR